MRTIPALILTILLPLTSFATPDYQKAAEMLYPKSSEDQEFVVKFFEIRENHKNNDPLMGEKGPSVADFGMNKQPIALMVNETDSTIDLVFLNWTLPRFEGLEDYPEMTQTIKDSTFIFRDVAKKSIATQGENRDELSNFSYVAGANYMKKQFLLDQPDADIPQELLDWKVHPDYMDRDHPLREALDGVALTLLSPSKEKYYGAMASNPDYVKLMDHALEPQGGFTRTILGMMVHETFHVKEVNDKVSQLVARRSIEVDRKTLVTQLKQDKELRALYAAYANTVFGLGHSLSSKDLSTEKNLLADLKVIIAELKANYPNAWKFIWDFEYTEGFAEYVAAQSMIASGVTKLKPEIDRQINESENNIAYRTGTIGGLHMYYRLKNLPFNNNEGLTLSVWEIILNNSKVPDTNKTVVEITGQYKNSTLDLKIEIDRIIEYLVSTEWEL